MIMTVRLLTFILATVALLVPARAQETGGAASSQCDVPAYLLNSDSTLANVATAVKSRQRLNILVAGTRSSSLPGPDGEMSAYPARLKAALRERLVGVTVEISTDVQPRRSAEETGAGLEKLILERKPDLVIWQTGTVDAIRSIDPDEFRAALDDGIASVKKAGSDVMLVNLQYSPRTDTVMTVTPYIDSMRIVAQKMDVPLFDRFSIMRDWQESGDFDLFGAPQGSDQGLSLAKRVHDCLGRAMSAFVIDAAHVNAAELRIQR